MPLGHAVNLIYVRGGIPGTARRHGNSRGFPTIVPKGIPFQLPSCGQTRFLHNVEMNLVQSLCLQHIYHKFYVDI